MDSLSLEVRIAKIAKKQSHLAKRIEQLAGQRLTWGLLAIGLFLLSRAFRGLALELVALVIATPLYFLMVFRSRRLKFLDQKLKALELFYQNRFALRKGLPLPSENHEDFPDAELSRDLDLNEIFSHLDITLTEEGARDLKAGLCGKKEESFRQKKKSDIMHLSQYPGWLRKLHIQQTLWATRNSSYQGVDSDYRSSKVRLENIASFLKVPLNHGAPPWRWLLLPLWVASMVALFTMSTAVGQWLYLFYLGATLYYIQSTASGFSQILELVQSLSRLSPVLQSLSEKKGHWRQHFPELCSSLPRNDLARLRQSLHLMSVQANPILFFILNGLMPWSLLVREWAERRRHQVQENFTSWSQEICDFDTSMALAQFFIYQTQTFAKTSTDHEFEFKGLTHPLIPENRVVANDFDSQDFHGFLITGSNMSGKSTFMRAIGVNFCLARLGAPVFAQNLVLPDVKLVTCIRVSDSLREGQSYFYAEVQRLKKLLVQAREQKVLFLIDEPLRGTNNQERYQGNAQYLERLLETGAKGFLCTHDLEMTKLTTSVAGLTNFHFTDEWKNQSLLFDYKIKNGPSKSTNALKILQKEGVIL